MTDRKPLRILHVVNSTNRAGLETWLMNVLRYIDRKKFRMDFLTNTADRCAYDDEILALGSRIIPCINTQRPLFYARNFKRILRQFGPFDFVHSHFRHYSGWVLRLAKRSGVPHRIMHLHSNISRLQASATQLRRIYLALTKQWINRYATAGLACSKEASIAFFGPVGESDPRWVIHYCGIDTAPFEIGADSVLTRAEFGISPDAIVVGHVGRFAEEKNHSFLLDIAAEVTRRRPEVRFLLIGDGPLRSKIVSKARKLRIDKKVIFAGLRPDVPRLMTSAMDCFLLPSFYEGLPLVLIEAQAAGLPCIFSDVVTEEADIVKSLMHRVSVFQPADVWAETLLGALNARICARRADALLTVARSPFNILASVRKLERFYRSCMEAH